MRQRSPRRCSIALLVLALAPAAAWAAESQHLYPAKVITLDGTVHHFRSLGHSFEGDAFVFYDGDAEGRVEWRDLDSIKFVGNLGHEHGPAGPRMANTRRVTLKYVNGEERTVNLVIGRVRGFDGNSEFELYPRNLSFIDFDEARIAPRAYKACDRGHIWEQLEYRFCPYDGLELTEHALPGGPAGGGTR